MPEGRRARHFARSLVVGGCLRMARAHRRADRRTEQGQEGAVPPPIGHTKPDTDQGWAAAAVKDAKDARMRRRDMFACPARAERALVTGRRREEKSLCIRTWPSPGRLQSTICRGRHSGKGYPRPRAGARRR
ncbi:hypothetical protein DENSPDRAFT_139337 [Dentipellis sp. KUC8613]|nr:hypothetical protein DENSPDRAFT_139337 [Dentipellis sp. KUC8613]